MRHTILIAATCASLLAGVQFAQAQTQDGQIITGMFRNADAAHRGSGTATISEAADGEATLLLSNFNTLPGPDLKVWLVKAGNLQNSSDVKNSEYVTLGALKSPNGDQQYSIPTSVKVEDYKSIAIWCERFGVLFTTADLAPAS